MDMTLNQTSLETVTLEVPDPAAAEVFYATAFGLGDRVHVRASQAPSTPAPRR
jgi:catechol-2,3-dioxygenase